MFKMNVDTGDLLWAALLLGAFLVGLRMRPNQDRVALMQRFMDMTDDDQLKLLVVFAIFWATLSTLLVMGFIFATKTFDAVVVSMASSYITLINGAAWVTGFGFFFMNSHGSKKREEAEAAAVVAEAESK